MRFFRRRAKAQTKAEALAEARKATARLRRDAEDLERYRTGKQPNPQTKMTTNQWIGS
jgi:hypothetical protein